MGSSLQTRDDKRLVCPTCGGLIFFVNSCKARMGDDGTWLRIETHECAECGYNNPEWKTQEQIDDE